MLATIAVFAALTDAGLAIVQRWCSSRVGEGLIYDLRGALFAKVQRMPIAFFTRTPTGSITSRLSSDVVGAQSAVTSTLGSVVSNVIVLTTTLAAMIALEWRLTLLTLIVLPLFIVPARRVGTPVHAASVTPASRQRSTAVCSSWRSASLGRSARQRFTASAH